MSRIGPGKYYGISSEDRTPEHQATMLRAQAQLYRTRDVVSTRTFVERSKQCESFDSLVRSGAIGRLYRP